MNSRRRVPMLLLSALVAGCGGRSDAAPAPADSRSQAAEPQTPAAQAEELSAAVLCGCAIEEVGHCGEYVEIDGEYVELALPAAAQLGDMPFCGRDGLRAELAGVREDDVFVASEFRLIE